jgi:hypothetical protein
LRKPFVSLLTPLYIYLLPRLSFTLFPSRLSFVTFSRTVTDILHVRIFVLLLLCRLSRLFRSASSPQSGAEIMTTQARVGPTEKTSRDWHRSLPKIDAERSKATPEETEPQWRGVSGVAVETNQESPCFANQKPLIGAQVLLDNDRRQHTKGVERCRSRFRNP